MSGKGFGAAILAATPLAAIILYFALSGQQQVRTDQQRHEIKQEIDTAKFDLEFDQASRDLDRNPMSQSEIDARKSEIATLEKKAENWDRRFDEEFKQMDEDMVNLKKAIDGEGDDP